MNKLFAIFGFVILSVTVFSQEWHTSFDEAKAESVATGKNIILSFQGSDWCTPCMKLEKEIWESQEFKTNGASHFILLKADFPRRKHNRLSKEQQKHNNNLAEKFNRKGYFPLVVVLDKEGKALGELGYEKTSASDYIAKLSAF